MADWYIDSSATGTGSGDSPANAHTNLTSIFMTVSGPQWGDRVWVRRTNVWPSTGQTWGRSGFNAQSHSFIQIIGWPNSGDDFYDERPAAGVSASWDSDAGGHASDLSYPTVVFSRGSTGTGFGLRNGTYVTNYLCASSISLSRVTLSPDGQAHYGNIKLLKCNLEGNDHTVDHITVICSYGSTSTEYIGQSANIGKITITASCVLSNVIAAPVYIGEVVNESNSIDTFLLGSNTTNGRLRNVGTVRGNAFLRPFAMLSPSLGGIRYPGFVVDDWYGQGPRRFAATAGAWNNGWVSSATAVYSNINSIGANATFFKCESFTAGTQDTGQRAPHEDYGGIVQQFVGVSSGRPYRIRLPFYVYQANCLDSAPDAFIHIRGTNGRIQRCSIRDGQIHAGTPARWAGSSIGAGSAYLMTVVFTSTVTQTICITGRPPTAIAVRSIWGFVPPVFEVESL